MLFFEHGEVLGKFSMLTISLGGGGSQHGDRGVQGFYTFV